MTQAFEWCILAKCSKDEAALATSYRRAMAPKCDRVKQSLKNALDLKVVPDGTTPPSKSQSAARLRTPLASVTGCRRTCFANTIAKISSETDVTPDEAEAVCKSTALDRRNFVACNLVQCPEPELTSSTDLVGTTGRSLEFLLDACGQTLEPAVTVQPPSPTLAAALLQAAVVERAPIVLFSADDTTAAPSVPTSTQRPAVADDIFRANLCSGSLTTPFADADAVAAAAARTAATASAAARTAATASAIEHGPGAGTSEGLHGLSTTFSAAFPKSLAERRRRQQRRWQ
ncbi:hypothetical protein HDU96_005436 [Phlyctochytrium bullatum]|nr:hypothetical protein HDU96_005436 [Phlyctochytrium bullatum]